MKDKLLPKSKFPIILGLTALLIALCAGCFSVYGISTLFAGASISAMVMASSLEIGKLVGTTFLYRYWKDCGILKIYLTTAVVVLMIITSLGIFGYLSAAYQQSSIQYGVTQQQITNLQSQKTFYQGQITDSRDRIQELTKLRESQESRLTQVLTNDYIERSPVQLKQLQQQNMDMISDTEGNIKDENQKIQSDTTDINKIDQQVNDLQLGTAGKKDIQTFRFVADALHLSLDTVARWFILSIIFVFDPLAICLILAYNVAVSQKNTVEEDTKTSPVENRNTPNIQQIEVKPEPQQVSPPQPPIPEPPKVEVKQEEQKHTGPSHFIRQMLKL
jgi:hypothetical protein